jgi:hypothetical protein
MIVVGTGLAVSDHGAATSRSAGPTFTGERKT